MVYQKHRKGVPSITLSSQRMEELGLELRQDKSPLNAIHSPETYVAIQRSNNITVQQSIHIRVKTGTISLQSNFGPLNNGSSKNHLETALEILNTAHTLSILKRFQNFVLYSWLRYLYRYSRIWTLTTFFCISNIFPISFKKPAT